MLSFHKVFQPLVMVFVLFSLYSCGGHLPEDNYPNPASLGYHRMEFDVIKGSSTVKEIGIGNILLTEDQSLEDVSFKIYGLYKGTLYMKSDACGINFSTRFDGISTFYLKNLIAQPTKCSIKITAETDKIKNKQHNIVESGVIKINVIPEDSLPLTLEYSRSNSLVANNLKLYSYLGQGSIQRQEGDLTSFEKFTVKTELTQGGFYRVVGCGNATTGSFEEANFDVSLKDIFAKDYLKKEDTCDLEIIIIPNEILETYQGRFSVSIYEASAVKLEALNWNIKKSWGKKYLYASGGSHIVACAINNTFKISNKCKEKYSSDKVYWVRAITSNARKSVFAIKNNTVIWKE